MSLSDRSRSNTQWFGIRVDGLDAGVKFPTVSDADESAKALRARGHRKVVIFDRRTGKPVEPSTRNSALN